ncbi:hypothetical protein RB597_002801 [Gaeumannomyces tritici]
MHAFLASCLAAWAALAGLAAAGPPVSGAKATADVNPLGGVCLAQWYPRGSSSSSSSNKASNMLSYHTRGDGSIFESRMHANGGWIKAVPVVLADAGNRTAGNASVARAWTGGGPLACAAEAVGDGPDDFQVRLFYQRAAEDAGGPVQLHSIVWKKDVGWRNDEAFNKLFGRPASAGAAIKWAGPKTGDVDWRLYYVLYDRAPYGTTRVRARIHEAVLRTRGADGEPLSWRPGSDGKPVASLLLRAGQAASVAAAALRGGRQISLVAWTLRPEEEEPGSYRHGRIVRRPGAIQETRWTLETRAWESRAQQLVDWGFPDVGVLAAAAYRERGANGGRELLLTLAKHAEPTNAFVGNSAVRQLVSAPGLWTRLMPPAPGWLAAETAASSQMAAASWLDGADGQDVRITLHYVACDVPDYVYEGKPCNYVIKEAQRNSESANAFAWTESFVVST